MKKIVYLVCASGGGMDGRDPTDKGGPRLAFFLERNAKRAMGSWDEKELRTEIVDVEQARAAALRKLSPVDKLVLGLVGDLEESDAVDTLGDGAKKPSIEARLDAIERKLARLIR